MAAKTNAEHQRAWRERQKVEHAQKDRKIKALEREVQRLTDKLVAIAARSGKLK